tara:strand:+ start:8709 stop:11669 length:2961 start_codon:yes stop_codon:yes gene_type:complete
MNKEIKINLRSIEAFSDLSDSNIKRIEEDIELLKYTIGQPICEKTTIPNKILIVLNGTARFLAEDENNNTKTISKLSTGSFIGLTSLLRAQGSEYISASSEVIAIAISDNTVIDLYKENVKFKNWCNSKLSIAEVHEIAYKIYSNNPKISSNLNVLKEKLVRNTKLISLENGINYKQDKSFINIVSSANIVGKNIGDNLENDEKLNIKEPFSGRILSIEKSFYNSLFELNDTKKLNEEPNNQSSISITGDNLKEEGLLNESDKNIGQYKNKKEFKLIKANGVTRESLACLQMLANELDLPYKVDAIEKVLRDSIREGNKPTMQLLGGITSMMGLHTSGARLNTKLGVRLPSPSLICWKESFAVVKESNSKILEIVSPSEGFIQLKPEQFEESFEKGFIEILLVEKHDQTPESKFGLKWLLPAIKRYRSVLLQVLLASFVVQLFGLVNPLMIQVIIDKVISQRSLDTLQILGIALVAVTILGGVISSLRTFLFNETTNRIDTRLGAEVIDHLLRLPLGYFDRRPVGELGSRIAELEKIRNFLTGQALTTILDAIFSLIYIFVMVIYSWLLTIIALGVVPIQILITIIGTPLIRGQIREIAKENAKTQSHLVEVLTGIQTVKAQNVERISRWKWQDLYAQYISKSFQKTITGTALNETSQVLQQLSQLLVLWIGATLVLDGQLTLGQLIAFRIISGYVTQPLLRLSTIWQNIQELRVSFERLADIIDTPEEANETDRSKIPLPSIQGSVEFQNVSFSFSKGQPEVLKNINLKINQGQFIGVVGQSGSGKSTLMKLLPRLYKPNTGKIIIDQYDIDKVELYSLRRQIGIVPQEPLLFAGSVNENIALTDPEASSDDIVKVAKIANAHEFIMELSDGYSTNIGERGAGLSGGQKQRIAIARTLLSNPKLLIMDEATSALDYQTERKVCEGLKLSSQGSTVFFITHRLSTVRNADLIVMLHQGSIAETGTHEELMKLKGRYFALYLQQESA